MTTVIVCGSRDGTFPEPESLVADALNVFPSRIEHVVVGSYRGIDKIAWRWALTTERVCTIVPAKWSRNDPAEGPYRNRNMLRLFRPAAVLAFPGNRGTEDMVNAARQARVPVLFWLRGKWVE